MKESVISNYIVHKKPKHQNFIKWYEYYKIHIINLFNIAKEVINDHYDCDENNDINFNDFVHLIYNSSSKYMFKDK